MLASRMRKACMNMGCGRMGREGNVLYVWHMKSVFHRSAEIQFDETLFRWLWSTTPCGNRGRFDGHTGGAGRTEWCYSYHHDLVRAESCQIFSAESVELDFSMQHATQRKYMCPNSSCVVVVNWKSFNKRSSMKGYSFVSYLRITR
jgi:hypothetical protein